MSSSRHEYTLASPADRLHVTMYVATGASHVSPQWVDEVRRLTDCDVRTWQPCSPNTDQAGVGDSRRSKARHLVDSVLSKVSAGAGPLAALFVVADHTESCGAPLPKSPSPPRGGLAPGVKRRICDLLDREYAKGFLMSDLAQIAKLSSYHFARAFKQSVGVPPHRYLLERRIAAAAKLVKDTNRCLADIALEVGFSDQSHFTRLFGRHMGETPRDFRRRHR